MYWKILECCCIVTSTSLVPRPLPKFYLTAVENGCEINLGGGLGMRQHKPARVATANRRVIIREQMSGYGNM